MWVRDNGPIFVRDQDGNLVIEDWGFNGWGGKYNSNLCDPIPAKIGNAIGMPVVDLNSVMVNEGGAVELDGNGVLMACRSSVLSQSPPNSVRNPEMTQMQAESIFAHYLGVTKFIWLDGNVGDPNDVTDFHIDGFAKFLNSDTLVTMNNARKEIKEGENFPNPFNESTTINVTLEYSTDVNVAIYNTAGQLVSRPVNSYLSAGKHALIISPEQLPDGVYSYAVTVDGQIYFNGRMVLLNR